MWDKVFKNVPSEICGRQPLKNLKWYGLLKQTIFHKFHLVHSLILCHIYHTVVILKSFTQKRNILKQGFFMSAFSHRDLQWSNTKLSASFFGPSVVIGKPLIIVLFFLLLLLLLTWIRLILFFDSSYYWCFDFTSLFVAFRSWR